MFNRAKLSPGAGLILAATLVLGTAGTAAASCLSFQDPEAELKKAVATAPVVFVGTVALTQHQGRSALVNVAEVWRGPVLPAQVVVNGSPAREPNAATSIDRNFTSGTKYIFLPQGNRSPFSDNACSHTQEFSAEIARLRPAGLVGPAGSPDGDASSFPVGPVALGSGLGLALIAGLWIALRRRSADGQAAA